MTTYNITLVGVQDLGSAPTPTRRTSHPDDEPGTPSLAFDAPEVVAQLEGALEYALQHGLLLSMNKAERLIQQFTANTALDVQFDVRIDQPEDDVPDHQGLHTTRNTTTYFEGEMMLSVSASEPQPFLNMNMGLDEWSKLLQSTLDELNLTLDSIDFSPALRQTLHEMQQRRDLSIQDAYTVVPDKVPEYLSRYATRDLPGTLGHLTITALDKFHTPLYANDPSAFLPDGFTGIRVRDLGAYLGTSVLDVRSDRAPEAAAFPSYPAHASTPEQAARISAKTILSALAIHAAHPAVVGFFAHSVKLSAPTPQQQLLLLGSILDQTGYIPFTALRETLKRMSDTPTFSPHQANPQGMAALALEKLNGGIEHLPQALWALSVAHKNTPPMQFAGLLRDTITPPEREIDVAQRQTLS